jgi:LysR family transcriptional regulator, nod-box dependent transcriptional activator
MRFRGLDLNHLVTLETLLTESSLTRAAERHFLTQPAISNALTKLREYFGDELLTRHGREMERTPFAEQLLPALRNALAQIHLVALATPKFDPSTVTRTFEVLASDYIAQVFLTEVIRHFSAIAPNVAIVHVPMSAEAITQFENGKIDVMIHPLGKTRKTPRKILFEEKWLCIARSDNTAFGESISAAQYHEALHVSPSYRHYIMDDYWQAPPDAMIRAASKLPFSAIPRLVAQTDFVALLPDRLVRIYEAQQLLRRIECEPPLPTIQMVVHWNPDHAMDSFLMWAIDQLAVVGQRLDT